MEINNEETHEQETSCYMCNNLNCKYVRTVFKFKLNCRAYII